MDPQDPRPSDAPDGASPPPTVSEPQVEPPAPAPDLTAEPSTDAPADAPVSADPVTTPAPASEPGSIPLEQPAASASAAPTEPTPAEPARPAEGASAQPGAAGPAAETAPEPPAAPPAEPASAEPAPTPAPEQAPEPAVPAAVYAPPAAAAVPVPTAPPASAGSDEPPLADDPAEADADAPGRRRGVGVLPLVLLCLGALLLAAGTLFLALQLRERSQTEDARVEALAASRDAARVLFSYNHESLDDDFSKGLAVTTGDFRSEYEKTTQDVVKDVATQYKAVVRANVNEAGVISASPDEVLTLVFLNQVTTSTRVEGEKIDQSRVRMRLVERDGQWLVDKVDAL